MEDLKTAAWMLRYGARSLAHNLQFIPEDRLDWKPGPIAKSAREIAFEPIRAMLMYLPIFDGPAYPTKWKLPPEPETREELAELLVETADSYAARLESAGDELDRAQPMPFGGTFKAYRAVCYPVMDLFNHHGQILYIQSLLGDAEMHWNDEAVEELFAWS